MHHCVKNLSKASLAIFVLMLSGCITSIVKNLAFSSTGEFVIQQRTEPPQHLMPDLCRSGELSAFLGFDLASSTGAAWRIRALIDPLNGPAIRITSAQSEMMLHKADCSVLDLNAYPSGVSINDINSYDGFVTLECSTPTGVRISGRVTVHNCPGGYLDRDRRL